jgi:suppressor for copper-sensitivity B
LLAAVVGLGAGPALAQSSTPVAGDSSSAQLPGQLPAGVTLPAGAVAGPGQIADDTKLRLIAAVDAAGDLAEIPAGLELRMAPGWKTYWRSPGDAGYPVTVDWAGSTNLAAAELAWPAPHRFTLFGLDTFGYADEVVFPVALRPERPGEPVQVRAKVSYLVCKEVCIPGEAELALDLPAGPAQPSSDVQAIDRFAAQVPDDGGAHGLALDSVAVGGSAGRPTLEIVARSDFPFLEPDVLVEGPADFYFAAPAVSLSEGGRLARLSLPVSAETDAPPLQETRITLTLVDAAPTGGRRGLESTLTPSPPSGPDFGGLIPVLGLALLGGLILNLMPCVLPVLSLKLLGVVGHGGGEARVVRASFLASAAGVIFAFLVLAGALAAVKAAGVAVGWGIQFQQPVFLAAMLLLLTLFACNLWGWYEIRLPVWLGDLAARGSGAGHEHGHGMAGHFATGAFATLLATPCSAPFLGTAVGFALAGTTTDLFAVFSALGVGLALPYLVVAAVPGIATALPRPGRWMVTLRQVLGLALAATAVWLLTVLAAQVGSWVAILAGLLLAAIGGALWLRRRRAGVERPARIAVILAGLALILLVGMPPEIATVRAPQNRAWTAFDESAIAGLVGEGRIVFVDVTADWCITCQVNKKLVLDDPEIAGRLGDPGIVAMQADWTRPDEGIARYLASFGRYGIPFNAVYGPGAPQGVVLPELLSGDAVRAALAKAAGPAGAGANLVSTTPE